MFEDIIDAMPIPAIVVASSERIEAANASAAALLGRGAVGRHYITIIRQPGLLDAIDACRNGAGSQSTRFLSTEARRDRAWLATVAPIGRTGAVLVAFEDRSEMEDAEAQRRDFVANVSHELRTPLTALLGFIETLQGAASRDPAAQGRFLGIMHREASRMNRLVNDLLSLTRVEGEERIRPSASVDVAQQVRSVVNALSPLAEESGVTIAVEGAKRPIPVNGDADQISQVITNLVENAIKYSGENSIVTVSLETSALHPMLRLPAAMLTVTDTGPGIDPIHIPRLTERFYRIDTHRSREQGGTGLGLAIVKHIVSRHRGRIRITSEIGKGSSFTIILPAFKESVGSG